MLEVTDTAQRLGPLSAAAHAVDGIVATIAIAAPEARWSLRMTEDDARDLGDAAGFDLTQEINRSAPGADGERRSYRLGPDEWLLNAPDAAHAETAAALARALGNRTHALVDISHRNVALTVKGRLAEPVLAAACAIDMRPEHFPVGMATRTTFAKAEIILSRMPDGPDGTPVFEVQVWRSFARYVAGRLRETVEMYEALSA